MDQVLAPVALLLVTTGISMIVYALTGWTNNGQQRPPRTRKERAAFVGMGAALIGLATASLVFSPSRTTGTGPPSSASSGNEPSTQPLRAPATSDATLGPATPAATSSQADAPGGQTGIPVPPPSYTLSPQTPTTSPPPPTTTRPSQPPPARVHATINYPANGSDIAVSRARAVGTVNNLPATLSLLCIVQDESGNYFPYTAQAIDNGWTADIGLGPPTISRPLPFTLYAASGDSGAMAAIKASQADLDRYNHVGVGARLPSGVAILATSRVRRVVT